jgi:hypothetical protein
LHHSSTLFFASYEFALCLDVMPKPIFDITVVND